MEMSWRCLFFYGNVNQVMIMLFNTTTQKQIKTLFKQSHLQCKRFVGIKLNEEYRSLVMFTHSNSLVVETAIVEGANKITDTLTFYTDVWCQDVVSHLYIKSKQIGYIGVFNTFVIVILYIIIIFT